MSLSTTNGSRLRLDLKVIPHCAGARYTHLLAALLRVSTRTIYDWVSQRKIPFRKAGDRTLFLRDEILEWTQPEGAE